MSHRVKDPLWGRPPQRVRGSYDKFDDAPRFKLGPREVGSIAENTAIAQPMIIATSYEIERFAHEAMPTLAPGMAGISSWAIQTLFFLALKIVANMLRNNGSSWIRDLGAFLWSWFWSIAKRWLASWLHGFANWILPARVDPSQPNTPQIDRRRRLAKRIRAWRDRLSR